jgi:uncharacterized protein (TIGR02145 family)
MKGIVLAFLALTMISAVSLAQSDTMYVMKSGSIIGKYKVSEIDSIIFYTPLKDSVVDADSNTYNTVIIGTQVWMAENLKVTKFNDGEDIPLVPECDSWAYLTTPGYCWYNNDTLNKNPYGAMYNWYVVSTDKLCPVGWHVPTNDDWTVLTGHLGGLSAAAGKLKEAGYTHWNSPNEDATNESKFTFLPGGYRRFSDGAFFSLRNNGTYWSSTSNDFITAWSRAIVNYSIWDVQVIANNKNYGISVRCIKD